ncbi:hypothetical protein OCU04_003087 [Sclerotinia nivalis]|uniref:Uncharacterized protein n=1 Tax=Sclerotinia nivalis TaxID=352851 RepID=A0A9X0AYD1_9HELO|nr:hypothetical protein OCU04_003087 [Sclerotinia nivalis]
MQVDLQEDKKHKLTRVVQLLAHGIDFCNIVVDTPAHPPTGRELGATEVVTAAAMETCA